MQLKRYAARGRLYLPRERINVSVVLNGQKLKEVAEGIWVANFVLLDLGYLELEQTTRQPFDNPNGTTLSPMS